MIEKVSTNHVTLDCGQLDFYFSDHEFSKIEKCAKAAGETVEDTIKGFLQSGGGDLIMKFADMFDLASKR